MFNIAICGGVSVPLSVGGFNMRTTNEVDVIGTTLVLEIGGFFIDVA